MQGYFDEKENLFERYVAKDGDADVIARLLGAAKPAMTNHQLRRFTVMCDAENRLKMTDDFRAAYIDLKNLSLSYLRQKEKVRFLIYSSILS